jgi:predicted GH43/DUF377 family glycosyl hydrolase
MKLIREKNDPILTPIKENQWESYSGFNCAAAIANDTVHIIYRAEDDPVAQNSISRLGYASSTDGINFTRQDQPVFGPEGPQEKGGVEDPRLTKINDEFYMLYTAYSGESHAHDWYNTKIAMASTKDFQNWKRWGVILDEVDNKDGALFPEKINEQYVLLHRRKPHIWLGYSDNFYCWSDHKPIMTTIENSWESKKIGIAGPPHKTDKGWLLFYHAVDNKDVYRLGVALLDLDDPSKVLIRQKEPILEPELPWEQEGQIPNVVFSCGSVKKGDKYYVYYGGADIVIGVASVSEEEVNKFISR